MEKKELSEKLESMIDKTSLQAVLYALSDVCLLKAEHLMTVWQDQQSARLWERMSGRLETIATKAEELHL